jgi:hypothetical protein
MKKAQPSFFEKNIQYNKVLLSLLKCFDKKKYYEKKRERAQLQLKAFGEIFSVPPPVRGRSAIFKHAGNAGDIVYALPAIRELAGKSGADLRLELGSPLLNKTLTHPLGGVMLNQRMFEMLRPLLEAQSYIKSVRILTHEKVDYDLDLFRAAPIPVDRMCISRWYFYLFGISADLSSPWLKTEADPASIGRIVVARSFRYRNLTLDYGLLDQFAPPVFVGLEEEYRDFKRAVPKAEWIPVSDFLQLARLIAGARLFIGNQSFPFALAEALKVPRILEVDPAVPNVIPTGGHAHDILFQDQLRHVLHTMLEGEGAR